MKRWNPFHRLTIWLAIVVIAAGLAFLGRRIVRKPSVAASAATLPLASAPVVESAAERKRRATFSDVTLKHIAEHFAVVSGRKITVAPQVAGLKIGGSITIDSIDSFLALISQIAPVRVEVAKDGAVQILPKDARE